MKKLVFLFLGLIINFSCTSQKGEQGSKVPYTEAKNYFVKNTYKSIDVAVKKITTQKDFDQIFGMAATMGKEGKPTSIDFSRNYVIALIGLETNANEHPQLEIESLIKKESTIVLSYITNGWSTNPTPSSYTILPVKILIVSKQYNGNVSLNKL